MFGSIILDVAVGLIFTFLVLSLVTSAAVEALASALAWRASTLFEGLKALLNDDAFTGLVREIYNHAAVNPRTSGGAPTADKLDAKPSYIDPKQFAAALIDVLQLAPQMSVADLQSRVNTVLPGPNCAQLRTMLNGMIGRAGGDIDRIRGEIADWFNAGMDRVAGVYKRKTQLWAFVIGLLLAILLNLDTVKIAEALWQQPGIMKGFVAPPAGESAQQALEQLQSIGVPFGWNGTAWAHAWSFPNVLYVLLGWLISAVATLFGAPFWFDTLQKFVQLRGAGSK
jgi:hypothetical protein